MLGSIGRGSRVVEVSEERVQEAGKQRCTCILSLWEFIFAFLAAAENPKHSSATVRVSEQKLVYRIFDTLQIIST